MIYSKKKKREKKEPWAFCVKLSPEIASSFWGKKLVFKKKRQSFVGGFSKAFPVSSALFFLVTRRTVWD